MKKEARRRSRKCHSDAKDRGEDDNENNAYEKYTKILVYLAVSSFVRSTINVSNSRDIQSIIGLVTASCFDSRLAYILYWVFCWQDVHTSVGNKHGMLHHSCLLERLSLQ